MGSRAPIIKMIPDKVVFKLTDVGVRVDYASSDTIFIDGKMYKYPNDLPGSYRYEAEQFEKLMYETFKDIVLITFIVSNNRLYAVVFYQNDDYVGITAYDVMKQLEVLRSL